MSISATITDYDQLNQYAEAFLKKNGLPLLFVVGHAGSSKSSTFKQSLNPNFHVYIKAARMTGFNLFPLLYEHRDKPIILDDVEDAIKKDDVVRLLMSVCETDAGRKVVTWDGKAIPDVPKTFRTSSRFVIICNEWNLLRSKFKALLDRGIVVFFDPSNQTIHEYAGEWFGDKEIYQFIGQHLGKIKRHSCRYYVNARTMKESGLDWRRALLESWEKEGHHQTETAEDAVRRLLKDQKYQSENQRIEAFVAEGRSRRNYFLMKKKLGA